METEQLKSWPKIIEEELGNLRTNSSVYEISRTGRVAGITYDIKENITTERFEKFALHPQVHEELSVKQNLDKIGLKYEAVLPTTLFDKLIKSQPFYKFKSISPSGLVRIDQEKTAKFLQDKDKTTIFYTLYVVLFGVIGSVWALAYSHGVVGCIEGSVLGLLAGGFIAFVTVLIAGFTNLFDLIEAKEIARIINAQDTNGMKTALWPDKTDIVSHNPAALNTPKVPERVRLIFPEAPAELQKTLFAYTKHDYKLYTVAHESAFKFFFSEQEIRTMVEEHDPIVCMDLPNNVTVIIGQYGAYEQEKELVEKLRSEFNIIKKEWLTYFN
jgi:hypothetical protein